MQKTSTRPLNAHGEMKAFCQPRRKKSWRPYCERVERGVQPREGKRNELDGEKRGQTQSAKGKTLLKLKHH